MQQQRQRQCNPDEHTLSQLFELSGVCFLWAHQREYRVDQGTDYYYYDEYYLLLQRGKQKVNLGSISLAKKLLGPTQFDFLKELRRQLDLLYGNTDEFERWNELYYQKHGEMGTRVEFERLVSLYVTCKKVVGSYWFPLLRLASDDIPSSPHMPGDEWEQMKSSKQATIESFLTSTMFTQLIHLLLDAHHRGTLPRIIIFDDINSSCLGKDLILTHPELSNQILEVPLLEAGFPPRVTEPYENLNLVEYLEEWVDQQATSIARIIQVHIGSRTSRDEECL